MKLLGFLRQWEIFSHFSDEQLCRLAECASAVVFLPTESMVLREGEHTRDVYLLRRGTVRIQRKTPCGLFVLAHLGPGSLFGETAFVDRGPRTGDAVTTTADTDLLVFDFGALEAACHDDPQLHLAVSWLFWKSISGKLRLTTESLDHVFRGHSVPPDAGRTTHSFGGIPPGRAVPVDLATRRKLFAEMRISGPEANFLATLSHGRAFTPHQPIFREGETAEEMYFVLKGRVMISKLIPGGGEEALGFIERGGCFGEMGLIDHAPRSADARAHEDGAVVLALSREVLEEILDVRETSSLGLLQVLCPLEAGRLRQLNDRLVTWFILAQGTGFSWPVEEEPEVRKTRRSG